MSKILVLLMLITLATLSCVKKPDQMVGPTIGSLEIMADENLKYIIEQEEEIFERTYKYADVNITYVPELDMIKKFMTDTVRGIFTTRTLTEEEKAFFLQSDIYPREYVLATGALAFVTRKNPTDTAYTYEDMIGFWKDGSKGKLFVIENAKSGISQEILKVVNENTLPSHFYALGSKNEVIDYVLAHENAIGIVDWSELSDSDNPEANEILNKVTLLGVSRPADSTQYGFVKPFQYNLQDDKYPFTRDLYFISTTGRSDVGLGFASFITGEIGQKIILKAGLLPKYQTERILEIGTSTDIKVVK